MLHHSIRLQVICHLIHVPTFSQLLNTGGNEDEGDLTEGKIDNVKDHSLFSKIGKSKTKGPEGQLCEGLAENVAEISAITLFKRHLGRYINRKGLEGYELNTGKWDLLRKAPWSACMNWAEEPASRLFSSVTL